MNDSTQTIWQSAKRFFAGTLLSRIAGMLRDMSMAYAFGTQASIASFMLAFRFSHLLRRLFGEGALQSVFIPEFEALRHEDPQKAFQFFRDLSIVLTLFLSLIITLIGICLGACLISGYLTADHSEIVFLTLLMLPSLLFICLYGFNASLLQCEKIFFTPSIAPVAFNGIWITAVLLLRYFHVEQTMPLLAIGVIIACFCQWVITLPHTFSIIRHHLKGQIRKNINLASPAIRKMIKPLWLGIMGVSATQANTVIDSLFARYAEPEGPAFLWYAMRLQQLPLALFGIAISGAILPPLSRAIKANDQARYCHFLTYGLKRTLNVMIPMTGAMLVLGDLSINLIYGRGDFTNLSVIGTTRCLWAYSIGLLPTTLVLILAPACYAQSDYRLPFYSSLITIGLNTFLNAVMIMGFHLGAMSVAIATSLSAWVNFLFLSHSLSKRNQFPILSSFYFSLVKSLLITGMASFGTYWIREHWLSLPLSSLVQGNGSSYPRLFFEQVFAFTYSLGTFFFFLLLGTLLCHLTFRERQEFANAK